jgi:hypothetical protein
LESIATKDGITNKKTEDQALLPETIVLSKAELSGTGNER